MGMISIWRTPMLQVRSDFKTADAIFTHYQNVPTTKKELARVIIAGVASEHDRTVDDLMSDSRVMLTAHARQEAMLRVYEQFSRFPRDHKWGISMPWLGSLFRRDHSTVLHAVRVARVRREEIRS